jgi:hypothetical protein
MKKTNQEIERLVEKYPEHTSRELFRMELEWLVQLATSEAKHKCMDAIEELFNE